MSIQENIQRFAKRLHQECDWQDWERERLLIKLWKAFEHRSFLFKHRKSGDKHHQLSTSTCRSSDVHVGPAVSSSTALACCRLLTCSTFQHTLSSDISSAVWQVSERWPRIYSQKTICAQARPTWPSLSSTITWLHLQYMFSDRVGCWRCGPYRGRVAIAISATRPRAHVHRRAATNGPIVGRRPGCCVDGTHWISLVESLLVFSCLCSSERSVILERERVKR